MVILYTLYSLHTYIYIYIYIYVYIHTHWNENTVDSQYIRRQARHTVATNMYSRPALNTWTERKGRMYTVNVYTVRRQYKLPYCIQGLVRDTVDRWEIQCTVTISADRQDITVVSSPEIQRSVTIYTDRLGIRSGTMKQWNSAYVSFIKCQLDRRTLIVLNWNEAPVLILNCLALFIT